VSSFDKLIYPPPLPCLPLLLSQRSPKFFCKKLVLKLPPIAVFAEKVQKKFKRSFPMIVGVNKRNLKKLNFAELVKVKVGKLLPNFIALLQWKETFMSKLPHICNFSNFQFV
jgi:hypothetical protein